MFARPNFARTVRGDVSQEIHGIPWRLKDDFHLVSHNKRLIPLCQFLRSLATENGLSETDLVDHQLKAKMLEDTEDAENLSQCRLVVSRQATIIISYALKPLILSQP